MASVRLAKFGDLAGLLTGGPAPADGHAPGRPVVVDVRRRLEWEDGHVAGAIHIPFSDLADRLGDVPPGEVWVHCQSGYRAMIAASLLCADGRQVVSVNDHFSNAAAAGLPLEHS
jgi:rhodanese-related sulfurtransferase